MVQIGYRKRRIFALEEARAVFPIIYRLTTESQKVVHELLAQLKLISRPDDHRAKSIELEIQNQVQKWQSKIESLGAEPKGLWIVDFDNGYGYFCWKFPEDQIFYCHGYDDGFQSRRHVEEDLFFTPEETRERKKEMKNEM